MTWKMSGQWITIGNHRVFNKHVSWSPSTSGMATAKFSRSFLLVSAGLSQSRLKGSESILHDKGVMSQKRKKKKAYSYPLPLIQKAHDIRDFWKLESNRFRIKGSRGSWIDSRTTHFDPDCRLFGFRASTVGIASWIFVSLHHWPRQIHPDDPGLPISLHGISPHDAHGQHAHDLEGHLRRISARPVASSWSAQFAILPPQPVPPPPPDRIGCPGLSVKKLGFTFLGMPTTNLEVSNGFPPTPCQRIIKTSFVVERSETRYQGGCNVPLHWSSQLTGKKGLVERKRFLRTSSHPLSLPIMTWGRWKYPYHLHNPNPETI